MNCARSTGMAGNTPKRVNQFTSVSAKETRKRLGKCWCEDIDWSLYPEYLRNVRKVQVKVIDVETITII